MTKITDEAQQRGGQIYNPDTPVELWGWVIDVESKGLDPDLFNKDIPTANLSTDEKIIVQKLSILAIDLKKLELTGAYGMVIRRIITICQTSKAHKGFQQQLLRTSKQEIRNTVGSDDQKKGLFK